ncbi:MAG: murein biosynthesis integral membrane protein MurJ [SAR86 cluster bacterium]|nr:murein biosynthesis integral membrane protein MurJ [SAR86 cluster bacterium]
MSFWTFVSRILGLARDIVFTSLLGAGVALDAYVVITKIPNVFRRIFAEGAFNQAFVPVLSEYKENNSENEVKVLINNVFGVLASALLVITAVVLVITPIFVLIFAPGFYEEPIKKELATDILRITFPYLFFVSLVALSGSIMNTYGKFSIPALTPVFYNLVLVCTAIWIAPLYAVPVYAIAWGMFVAGCIQLLIQIYPLLNLGLLPKFSLDLKHPGVKKVVYLMIPGIIAGGVTQLNMLVDTILASFLPTGSPTWLYVSDRLMQLPLGIFAIAIGTVILPRLSSLHQTENTQEFSKTMDWSIRLVLLIGFPAIIGLVVLSEPIILTLFERGEFLAADTSKTSLSLIALALGLVAFMLIKVLIPGFFARQNPQTPVKIALASMLVNGLLAWLLAFYLGFHHVGLAMASSIAAYFSVMALLFMLLKNKIYQIESGWLIFFARMIISCLVMYFIVALMNIDMVLWRELDQVQRAVKLLLICTAAIISYAGILWISGLRIADLRR